MQPTLAPAMQHVPQDNAAAEASLREHLLAQVHSSSGASHHQQQQQQQLSQESPYHTHHQRATSETPPERGVANLDPAIAGSSGNVSMSAGESGGEEGSDGKRGGKRELSTSKRAAQNRAAQRAFRQRKEGYIRKLEDQVRDYNLLNENYKTVQAENYQLRDYIINLQSRLIESQGDFPQPPSNIDLPHPRNANGSSGAVANSGAMQHPHTHGASIAPPPPPPPPPAPVPAPAAPVAAAAIAPTAQMVGSQLQASAARAVADLRNHPSRDAEMTEGPQRGIGSSGSPTAPTAA
ncbi:hypothetical protein MMC09_004384 [Bachmanniomyces sp. S44760]|nr:hypothetical protein [Bachmanniomyces sp. S44760]